MRDQLGGTILTPAFPPRAFRPRLRITTALLNPSPVAIHRPIPICPPGNWGYQTQTVKSAPLLLPIQSFEHSDGEGTQSNPFQSGAENNDQPRPTRVGLRLTDGPKHSNKETAEGHKSCLSTKLRSLLANLVRRNQPLTNDPPPDENISRREGPPAPSRPLRCPGTARFLVHRHLPSSPACPLSSTSTSGHPGVFPRRLHIAAPTLQIRHSSNSIMTATSGTRSIAVSAVESVKSSAYCSRSVSANGCRILGERHGGD
jgi:hypothetical protein